MAPRRVDPVVLELRPERLARDVELLRGERLVAAGLLERVLDRHPLDIGQGRNASLRMDPGLDDLRPGAPRAHHLERQMLGKNRLLALEEDAALDHVPELADVPRP